MTRAKVSIVLMLLTLGTVVGTMRVGGGETIYVPTTTIQLGDLVQTTALTGVVSYQHRQPMLTAYGGKIARVYVYPGERVHKGQLLIRMDTTAEEKMLSQIQHSYHGQAGGFYFLGEEIPSLAQAQNLEWFEMMEQLQQRIDMAQIRASSDGVVEAVYYSEGDYVSASAVLGLTRGEKKCVIAMQNIEGETYAPGTTAIVEENGQAIATAVLNEVNVGEEKTVQQLCFLPIEDGSLAEMEVGELVTLQVSERYDEQMSLVPLAAVNRQNEIWIVEGGKAFPASVSTAFRNEKYIGLSEEWFGKKVVLDPEAFSLYAGCVINEADAR